MTGKKSLEKKVRELRRRISRLKAKIQRMEMKLGRQFGIVTIVTIHFKEGRIDDVSTYTRILNNLVIAQEYAMKVYIRQKDKYNAIRLKDDECMFRLRIGENKVMKIYVDEREINSNSKTRRNLLGEPIDTFVDETDGDLDDEESS